MTVEERMRSLGLDPDEPNPWPGTLRIARGVVFAPLYAMGKNGHAGYTVVSDDAVVEPARDGSCVLEIDDAKLLVKPLRLEIDTNPATLIERILRDDGHRIDEESFARARRQLQGKWCLRERVMCWSRKSLAWILRRN